jgi:hypothetical protein
MVSILSSCSNFDRKPDDINTKLLGTWVLDSISIPSGHYSKMENDSKTLTFINQTDYSFEWWNGDAGNTFTGKYFVLDNPKRGLKTISFVPDIQLSGQDTIRIAYMNFDIVSLASSRLQVVDETEFVKRDSLPYIRFNKNYIYKRTK